MSRSVRLALVALSVAAAVVLFVVARPEDEAADDTPPATEAAPPARPSPGPGPAPVSPARPKAELIRVRGGAPVGGVKRISLEKGETVRMTVSADAPEHVHVHGYDIVRDVGPGKPGRFRFPAKLEGIFDVELENSRVLIARLRVEP